MNSNLVKPYIAAYPVTAKVILTAIFVVGSACALEGIMVAIFQKSMLFTMAETLPDGRTAVDGILSPADIGRVRQEITVR